jgi:hypothetical protein
MAGAGHPSCIEQGAISLISSSLVPGGRLPLRAGIESQAGLNCSGTGSNERRKSWQKGTRRDCGAHAGSSLLRLVCTLKRFAPRALKKYILSAETIAMTVAGGFNSRLRK